MAPEVMRQRGELELHSAGTKVSGELSLRGLRRVLGAGMGTETGSGDGDIRDGQSPSPIGHLKGLSLT